jgi:hypothetical protein
MSHERWDGLLSNYLDGELTAAHGAEVEHHIGSCEECSAALEEYREIQAWARSYRHPAPKTDPWDRIEREVLGRARRSRWVRATQGIAASVAILIVVGNAWVGWIEREPAPVTIPAAPSSVTAAANAPLDDDSYAARVGELEAFYEQAIPHLDPRTVDVLRESLLEIDSALERASAALAADPANRLLRALLERSRAQKLDLLRDIISSL